MNPLLKLLGTAHGIQFGLAHGIQFVFRYGIEFSEIDFAELTPEQYAAYRRKEAPTDERIYRVVLREPTAIERTPEKVTYLLEIVFESEKACILDAVECIHKNSRELNRRTPNFGERLEFLRRRWPAELTGIGE